MTRMLQWGHMIGKGPSEEQIIAAGKRFLPASMRELVLLITHRFSMDAALTATSPIIAVRWLAIVTLPWKQDIAQNGFPSWKAYSGEMDEDGQYLWYYVFKSGGQDGWRMSRGGDMYETIFNSCRDAMEAAERVNRGENI